MNSGSGVKVQFTRQESHSHISIPNGQLLTKGILYNTAYTQFIEYWIIWYNGRC